MKVTTKNIILLVLFALVTVGFAMFSAIAKKNRSNAKVSKIVVDVKNPAYQFVQEKHVQSIFYGEIDSINSVIAKTIDLDAVEQKVKENPYVDNCEAFINNKNQLCFKIWQKEPLFRVFNNSDVNYYVDKQGVIFPNSSNFTANVPIVTGHLNYELDSLGVQTNEAVNNVIEFIHYIKTNETATALIASVNVQPNGDIEFVPRMGKHKVIIGKPELLDEKFNRLFVFYKEGLSRVGWNKYSEINLKYNHQVIAKKGV